MSEMETRLEPKAAAPSLALSPKKAAIGIILLFPIIGTYFVITIALGLAAQYAGFIFLLYWAGFRGSENAEIAPAMIGMIAAIGICWMLHALPAMMGQAGLALPLILILISVFCLMCGWLPLLFNQGSMLMLTIGGIGALAATNPYADMATCVVIAAAYFGGLKLAYNRVTMRASTSAR